MHSETVRPRILVIASGAYDYQTLEENPFRDSFQFFFEPITIASADILDFIAAIKEKYCAQNLDGVLGTHDGPESTVAAILAAELGLHGLPPQATFVCEHKYYSRLAQQSIVPSAVPGFQCLPVRNLKQQDVTLSYPFFVKPVKSAFSILARPVANFESLEAFLPKVRARLDHVIPAFNALLKRYSDLELDAGMLIAEELLDGLQVTVDGFSWRGEVTVMGITDSIMYPGKSSFERFEYPSRLPAAVQRRMERIAHDLVVGIGVDYSMFNIEMFYNAASDAIHVIEINPRMSYQFADMFAKVDGVNSYTTQLQLCMGEKPHFVKGAGQFGVAASFVLRLFENQRVTRVPTKQELREIQRLYPDALIVIKVEEGTMLSELSQDEQSYRYAIVNLGGQNWQDLQARFRDLNSRLNFKFASIQACDDEARGRYRVAAGDLLELIQECGE